MTSGERQRDQQAAFTLPAPEGTVFDYDPITIHGTMAYLAGQIPKQNGEIAFVGLVGRELNFDEARQAAIICADQALAWLAHRGGGLGNVARILKANCYVAHEEGFADISKVADAASGRFLDVLGPTAKHSRSVLGVRSLPRNAPVLLEVTAALKEPVD